MLPALSGLNFVLVINRNNFDDALKGFKPFIRPLVLTVTRPLEWAPRLLVQTFLIC
jgi:hypothetical protein